MVFACICDTLNLLQVFLGSFDVELKEWENSPLLISSSLKPCVAWSCSPLREGGYGSIKVSHVTWPIGISCTVSMAVWLAGSAFTCSCLHLPAPYLLTTCACSTLSIALLAHFSTARGHPFVSLELKGSKHKPFSPAINSARFLSVCLTWRVRMQLAV